MKKQTINIALFILIFATCSSCEVIGGIFKAGMGVGIFLVLLVLGLLIFAFTRMGKNK